MNRLQEMLITALSSTKLFEMAMDRAEMKNKIDALLPQIIENWCLVKYCHLTNNKQDLVNHWSHELYVHILRVARFELKKSSTVVKLKLVKELFNVYDFDTKPDLCTDWASGKFADEKLPDTYDKQIGESFVKNINKLYTQLVCGTRESIQKYVNSI